MRAKTKCPAVAIVVAMCVAVHSVAAQAPTARIVSSANAFLASLDPEIADALNEQARKLVHVSNLYYNELQGRLAQRIVDLIAPGRVFFCNSGAGLSWRVALRKKIVELIFRLPRFEGRIRLP